MVKKLNGKLIATASVTPPASPLNPHLNTTSITFPLYGTLDASAAVDEDEVDLHGSSPPRCASPELETKRVNRRFQAISSLINQLHAIVRGEEEEEVEGNDEDDGEEGPTVNDEGVGSGEEETTDDEIDFGLHDLNIPDIIKINSKPDAANRRRLVTTEDMEIFEREKEYDLYHDSLLRRASNSHVRFEQDSSTTSSTSSSGRTQLITPSISSADDMEEDPEDPHDDSPPMHTDNDFNYMPTFDPDQPPSHDQKTYYEQKRPSPPHRQAQKLPPSLPPQPIPPVFRPLIPKHELFLCTMPSSRATVPEVRSWISHWFLGRDIDTEFQHPWNARTVCIQDFVDCISWSGDEIHQMEIGALEHDLQGWMLRGWAKPIVRDIEKARKLIRDRKIVELKVKLFGALLLLLLVEVVVLIVLAAIKGGNPFECFGDSGDFD